MTLLSRPTIKTSYRSDASIVDTPVRWILLTSAITAGLYYPTFGSRYSLNIAILIAFAVVGSQGLNLLVGVAGQMSIGSAAFMAIGGFTSAALATDYFSVSFPVALVLSSLAAGAVGVLVGIPALRLRGLYLVVATLALQYVVSYGAVKYQAGGAGPAGFVMPPASIAGWTLASQRDWYYIALGLALVATFVAANLLRTKYGRAWMAIRSRDIAAEIIGVNVAMYKVLAFMVSSIMIGAWGTLLVYYIGTVSAETFTFTLAIQAIAMILLGGLGSVLGSILGAAFVIGLPFVLRELANKVPNGVPGSGVFKENLYDIQTGSFGVAIIVFLIFEPRGLVAIWTRLRDYFHVWPFRSINASTEVL